ncbi:hypothetical protein [Methylobacterium durans]|jgi:hypothetical protein|uniref:Uncharacterized protein n=1 Tax=Methylobacterium durans TaxID=2202825 RepID=A0A2U8WC65_9HYPH|nr:hypothetical protein [Methylobacterium durans]AWN43639.1 hypothetical protein DK389_27935 [Methylobacterium durans]
MDRERDRDSAEAMIAERDRTEGRGDRDRTRPGQGDETSGSVDRQTPPPESDRSPETDVPKRSDPGPFAPH